MQTELERTQEEIAKVQLQQERIKLAQLQRRQRAEESMRSGAVAVGQSAANGAAWLGSVLAVCLTLILVTFLVLMATLSIKSLFQGSGGYGFGYLLGLKADVIGVATIGMPALYYLLRLFFVRTIGGALLGVVCALLAAVFMVAA